MDDPVRLVEIILGQFFPIWQYFSHRLVKNFDKFTIRASFARDATVLFAGHEDDEISSLVSTLMARLPRIYISLQISDLKSISNAIVKIASLSSNKVEWRRRFDPEKFDCPSEDHSIKPINKQLRGKSKNNAGTL